PLAVRIAGLHRGAGAPLGAGDALAAAGARGAIADEGAALRRAPRGRRVAHADLATRDALGAERRALTAAVALRADELTRCLRAGLPGDAVAGDDDRVFGGAGALGLANGARAHAHAAFAVAGAGALVRPLTVFPAQGARLAIAVAVARAAHAAARAIDARELAEVGLPLSDVVAVLRLNA